MTQMPEPRIIITSGEPAGIGPDIIASIDPARFPAELTVIGDRDMLKSRADALGSQTRFCAPADKPQPGKTIAIEDRPLATPCVAGKLDRTNAQYVLGMLRDACLGCLDNRFEAMVTAPVHKEIINRAGISFSGHTEYLAEICKARKPVMLLATDHLRVALVTTHLPLRQVADAVTADAISEVVEILDRDLRNRFGIRQPHIKVCGLNPHAGENGYLGREEIDTIIPAMEKLKAKIKPLIALNH